MSSSNDPVALPDDNGNDESEKTKKIAALTPIRAHYLKKALIHLQVTRELNLITAAGPPHVSTLSYLGQPFSVLPKDAPPLDLPFLKYIFRQFVLSFPFLAAAPKDFYSQKLQPFVAALLSRNLSRTSVLDDEKDEEFAQKKIIEKLERNLAHFLGSATKLVEPEEVVRLTQADLNRLEVLSEQRRRRPTKSKDTFEVNIVTVRTVIDKGRVRSRGHDEFIIRTRRARYPDVYVSRRYGDFKTLYQELIRAHPEENIRLPPVKDRSYANAPVVSPTSSRSPDSLPSSQNYLAFNYDHDNMSLNHTTPKSSRLVREKNRLTLRSYLHSLLSSSTVVASSPVIRSFLLSGSISLTPHELEDAKLREEVDRLREEGRKTFAREIASRIDGLRVAVKSLKGDIMGKDGLSRVFAVVKETPNIRNLPADYQSVIEWARISLASTVYQVFLASDDASVTLASLKRIHGLMPYLLLKGALKVTNPVAMIRNVLDLFLATPFGGKSLLQRMFTTSLTEGVKHLEEEIMAVSDKVEDPIMCAKIHQFVNAPRDIQTMFKNDAKSEHMDIITIILRCAEPPALSRSQMHRLSRAHKAHTLYLEHRESLEDSDDDEGPQDEDAWLIEDLKVLADLYFKLKDRKDLIDLIFEGFTADLLKDILTIFYTPLAQVYRAANIADSLNDLQNFITDLIRTVEAVEDLSQDDMIATVQMFIDLIQRHEQAFYTFVHNVHSKGEGLFNDLMHWIELSLTVIREGLGESLSLEFLLPHTGEERDQIISEIDKVALYHYKLKVSYEEKLRRRFGRAHGNSDADREDELTQELLNDLSDKINFSELLSGDAIDLAAQMTDDESSSEEYSSEGDTSSESGSNEIRDQHHRAERSLESSVTSSTLLKMKQPPQKNSQHPHQSKQHSRIDPVQAATPQQPIRRHRSLSLKRVRSLISLRNGFSQRSNTPPVPPIPKSAYTSLPKPLPSKPLPSSPADHPQPTPSKSTAQQQQQTQDRQLRPPMELNKKPEQQPKLPELKFIPQLLPVFVEMMKPSLRIQKAT